MPTNVNLQQIIINSVPSKEIYNQMKAQGLLEPNQLYLVEEDPSVADMSKSVYDANGVVQNAGGIVEYVAANGGKIDVIKINSTPVPIVDKAVDIDIPTELSELSDDATHRVVTDTEKAAWNAKGTYSKPSGGIPKSDLDSSVQGSLSKADSALQSFTETDPVFKASPAYGISSNDIENWDNKQSPISDLGTIRNNAAAGAAKVSCTDEVVASFGYTKNTGDMEEAVYDPDGLVAAAGGIPEYVESHSIDPSEKGNSNGVATLDSNGKLSASQVPEMDYQPTINVSGILKGNGAGGISAAVAGTDYAPGGYGYGQDIRFTSWDDTDGSQLEAYLDGLIDGSEKIIRINTMTDYPALLVSGNGGYADVNFTSHGGILVKWHGYNAVTADSDNGASYLAVKKRSQGKRWSPWEYINPPMETNVVYRTTERRNGDPVYKKQDSNGIRYWSTDQTNWNAESTVKFETGSYVGTGTYGASNPTRISFGFTPSMVFVFYSRVSGSGYDQGNGIGTGIFNVAGLLNSNPDYAYLFCRNGGSSNTNYHATYKSATNTLEFYSTSAQEQFNLSSGFRYFYVAIG